MFVFMVGTVTYDTAPCCYKKDLGPAKLFSTSNIVDLSFLEQLLDLFKSLYPSKRRKPMSNSKRKESKQEISLLKIAGKSNTIY